jgi:hypothetical protein
MSTALDPAAFDAFYDALAAALDRVPEAEECAFLCRLALILAHGSESLDIALAAIASAEASGTDHDFQD